VLTLAALRSQVTRPDVPGADRRKLLLVPPLPDLPAPPARSGGQPTADVQHKLIDGWVPPVLTVPRTRRVGRVSPSAAKGVLRVLRSFAHSRTGVTFPSEATIAGNASLCVETVRLVLHALVGSNVLAVVRLGGGRGRATVYRIRWEVLEHQQPGTQSRETKPGPGAGNHQNPGTEFAKPGTESRRSLRDHQRQEKGRGRALHVEHPRKQKQEADPRVRELVSAYHLLVESELRGGKLPSSTWGRDGKGAKELLSVAEPETILATIKVALASPGFFRSLALGGLPGIGSQWARLVDQVPVPDHQETDEDLSRQRRQMAYVKDFESHREHPRWHQYLPACNAGQWNAEDGFLAWLSANPSEEVRA